MKRHIWLFVLLLLVLATNLLPSAVCAEENAEPVCIQCHSKMPEKYSQPVTLWRGSIHAENGIFCNGCQVLR